MKAKTCDKIATAILYIISAFIVLLLIGFIGYIIYNGRHSLNLSFLFGKPKIDEPGGGIGPQLFNSFYMLIISLIITVPIGIGAGIYMSQYAKEGKILNIIRLCIETMASLPSIVVGLFGLLVFVTMTQWGYTLLSGALAITVINLPAMTRVCENAITASAAKVKEASLGLGATQWQTIQKVMLPSAIPQILTGIILAAGRIFGEAAALLYTAGMSAPILKYSNISLIDKASPFSLFRPAETLAVHIWKLNSEGMVPDASKIATGSSAVLVIMVLVFNILARIIGKKIYNSYSGK
ncbi:phosphate ABC transporter, permease protein PstA [Clostridium pasteurianum DSM 525 = ATCC 6013]|uniref:Phosphate transport system permease protein PstA n=1 Tax=Clostridium pasteurianum DSM 525 = ATCC 6013 TaxID=1262449 RepID=A0A0H3J540_CLOPA|nr:phosphate ABC transporter permease PstA [Clostridium pasteurianum]AJA48192.1 phosphate ABC transporter, permease protein PstA [Clostridium pasteurianum DSM 525 = ATCC 6013]AJA52180.1 phosphate ABC transporter, permease protein PstA [Clostridium pasteurianum DSM 525 = ATCC 6013]AOZ75451.1 phosphate ABC transporter permease [Clostridium pasteurianum DSM 525 = ATCC 6013]AOZ79246.1 phosphate ABC transporter permease [Clostridium pasteurianum]ELP60656.1 Permease component of ATP-dependent phosph